MIVFPPLGINMMADCKSVNIDVKHKQKNQNQNAHHLGIATRIDYFLGYFIDELSFVADIFVTSLSVESYKFSFYHLLEIMKKNDVKMDSFLQQLELIVCDFCSIQQQGLQIAINMFLFEHNLNHINVTEKISGCEFHWKQSVLRIKNRLENNDKKLFQAHVDKISNIQSKSGIYEQLSIIQNSISGVNSWCRWWQQDTTLNLLFNCLHTNDMNTNNQIESLHAKMSIKSTAILNYKDSMNRYIDLYNYLATVLKNVQTRYTHSPKRVRYENKKRKRKSRYEKKKNQGNYSTFNETEFSDEEIETDNNEEEIYNIECLEKKVIDTKKQVFYQVKWENFDEYTFEPEENIDDGLKRSFKGPVERWM